MIELNSVIEKINKALNSNKIAEILAEETKSYEAPNKELENFKSILLNKVEEIKKSCPEWQIKTRENTRGGIDIISYGIPLVIEWNQDIQVSRPLHKVEITLFSGMINPDRSFINGIQANNVGNEEYYYDIDINGVKGWSKGSRKEFKTSDQLATHCLDILVSYVLKSKKM